MTNNTELSASEYWDLRNELNALEGAFNRVLRERDYYKQRSFNLSDEKLYYKQRCEKLENTIRKLREKDDAIYWEMRKQKDELEKKLQASEANK